MTLTHVAPLLGRLPVVLQWAEEGGDVVADAMATHRTRLETAMAALLEGVEELARSRDPLARSAALRELAPAWARADHQARWRVILAPASSRRLLWMPQRPLDGTRWLTMALAHEAAVAAGSGVLPQGLWSALGDRHITAGSLPGVSAAAPLPSPCARPRGGPADCDPSSAAVYRAPVIANGIPVDAWSPLARTVHMTRCNGVPDTWPEFDQASLHRVTVRLEEALAGLRATSAVASALVETLTLVVVVRAPGHGFGHGSTVVDLGRTVIIDPLAPAATPVRLAEALLHEAVHHLCNVTVSESVWVQGEAGTVLVESPWTGNPLALTTYLQACLVWAALRTFWVRAGVEGTFDRGAAGDRRVAAERGFEAGPVLDRIPRRTRAFVNPLVAEAIGSLSRP